MTTMPYLQCKLNIIPFSWSVKRNIWHFDNIKLNDIPLPDLPMPHLFFNLNEQESDLVFLEKEKTL